MAYKKEGEAKDLVEKLRRGELTPEEVIEEMKKRGLCHHDNEPIPGVFATGGMIAWAVLCFLPVICEIMNINIATIPSTELPLEIVYFAFFLVVAMAPPLFYSAYLREKRSITGDENIVLVKSGAYGIVRHPAALAGLILCIALPIILNRFALKLSFTALTVLGETAIFAGLYLQTWHEEKVNIRKWGDEYRQYMKKVPRFNFILGIWRWARQRSKKPFGMRS